MDRQAILYGSYFSLDEKSGKLFRLVNSNWNDFGYYTLYALEMKLPESAFGETIAYINIMNMCQRKGEKPTWIPSTPMVFISSIKSAEALLIFLSPEQRSNLEKILLLQYDTFFVSQQDVFNISVLRGTNRVEFDRSLTRIKELVRCPLDISSMIDNHKIQLAYFLKDIKTDK